MLYFGHEANTPPKEVQKTMFADMCSILQEKQSGEFSIEKFTVPKDDLRAIFVDRILPGDYIKLVKRGRMSDTIMSNTPMEERTNRKIVSRANGKVFIAGWGIGLILLRSRRRRTSHQ